MRLSFVLSLLLLTVSTSLQQALAQVTAPSSGGYVTLESATATTMRLRFNGSGQGRVIAMAVAPQATPVPLAAVDNTFYKADPTYSYGSTVGKATPCITAQALVLKLGA